MLCKEEFNFFFSIHRSWQDIKLTMGENVQCPVCTLYLHAGMNLSDHLETHPKEQVIKALVQLTISGVGGCTSALASVLKGESADAGTEQKKYPHALQDEKQQLEKKIYDLNKDSSTSNCRAAANSFAISDQNTANCIQNSNSLTNFSNLQNAVIGALEDKSKEPIPTKQSQKLQEISTLNKDRKIIKEVVANDRYSNIQRTYHHINSVIELTNGSNFSMFGNQRINFQQHRLGIENQQQQLSDPSQMPPPRAPLGHHQEISRAGLPPPHQIQASNPQSSISGTTPFHRLQAQQLQNTSNHHAAHLTNVDSTQSRHPNLFSVGQHQQNSTQTTHQQQDLKVIYSSGLPPPPPLQLFTYQPVSQAQHHHQKPPPAYGTAISQIRSQNTQSKPQGTNQHVAQNQHPSMTAQHFILHQQQMQHQHPAVHHNLHDRFQQSSILPTSSNSAKQPLSTSNEQALSHPVPTVIPPSCTRQTHTPALNQNKYCITQQQTQHDNSELALSPQFVSSINVNEVQSKSNRSSSSASAMILHSGYPQVSRSPLTSTSIAAVAASTLSRHTNSPIAALLAAAAVAPSTSNSSSVLRYAESPVAHYLERENGDFIVQETPKHIVECVEKDNGEFSVIERIYQSPPSVLHIHDDDDDDDEEKVEGNDDVEENDKDVNKSESADANSKESVKESMLKTNKNKTNIGVTPPAKDGALSCPNNKANKKIKHSVNSSHENEIVDFVSISSDSEEEEFISHERKDQKVNTEKTKKLEASPLRTSSPSSVPPTQSTSSEATTSYLGTEAQTVPSTSLSTLSNNVSTSTYQNGTRKKSSKNTITVLSDVQLNLNEYLDLVGNIIASSKVAAQRRSFSSLAPIPLVKIEKEEPMDDYSESAITDQSSLPKTANKQETEDEMVTGRSINISSNNLNNVRLNDNPNLEGDETKPLVLDNIHDNAPPSLNINSSHVTSVIRMATTSQNIQHPQLMSKKSLSDNKALQNIVEAEDLSQNVRKAQIVQTKSVGHTSAALIRKVPKKLVIKPKSTRADCLHNKDSLNDIQQPSTSTILPYVSPEQNICDDRELINEHEVKVKNEPITSIVFDNLHYQQQNNFSILEQHLSSKEPILVCKEEKPCIQETTLPIALKLENNVNDDARILYDFATSKKCNAEQNKCNPFPSTISLFANSQKTSSADVTKPAEHSDTEAASCSSHSAIDATMQSQEPSPEHTKHLANNTSLPIEAYHNSQTFTDFPFNCLYNGNNNLSEPVDVKKPPNRSSVYQSTIGGDSNGNNKNAIIVQEDSSSGKHCTDYQQSTSDTALTHHQWFSSYHQTADPQNIPTVTTNLNVSIPDECSAVLDGTGVGKYLDLDTCKQDHNTDVGKVCDSRMTFTSAPPPSSSTSCSFTGATENSMAGISSSGVTLNIRTDEKMPAKGEISEQESNCDIDNSWSQPIYGETSARFFKTTFPGIFPQDNGWNQEEYFTAQDLSTSAASQAVVNACIKGKSFDFRTDGNHSLEEESSGIHIFSPNCSDNGIMDSTPSTSAKLKKRRKHGAFENKVVTTPSNKSNLTSTITSQEILQSQNEMETLVLNFHQQEQQPSTSSAFLSGASSSAIVSAAHSQQKVRSKIYECGHCNVKYSKLRDRNAHMVEVHNYVRQNRRLVCLRNGVAVPMTEALAIANGPNCSTVQQQIVNSDGSFCDLKPDIVKIENDNIHPNASGFESINVDFNAKTEIMDDVKQTLAMVKMATTTSKCIDDKPPNTQPLSITTTTSKLTGLYRMLVTFNMTTLKQNQRLTEIDESLIKSSIFFCYICRQNFNSVKLYDAHLTEHPAECFTCGKKFQRWKNFSLHLKRHLGWKEFGCTVCDKKFVVRSALIEHMRMHSGLSPLKCKVCGKHFKRYSNLTQHRKRHSPKQLVRRKEFVCYCGEVLPSKARFLWHKETHDSKPKCCPHCCDRFVHVNSLRRHIRLAHSDKFNYAEPMECPVCKQIFAKASMKAHMATHSTDTQYDCVICNKSFSTKWNLKIHSWVHANRTAKPFKCEHCPKAFVREVDFKNHMNSHKQIKPYTCEVCGCKFIRKYNYMRHRREHHGNKKFTCDLCKKSFHRHYYLIEHRRIHTGERPFQCTICGKSSTTKTNHNKHLKIHHSRDPFTVEV